VLEGPRLPASGFGRLRACWLLAVALGPQLAAQAPEQARFEVASIRAHSENGDTRVGIEDSEGFVRISNLPIRNVIALAYDVMPENVAGRGTTNIPDRPARIDCRKRPADRGPRAALVAERLRAGRG